MRLLSWNVLQGAGRRVEQVIAAVAAIDSDIICLQEFRSNDAGELLLKALSEQGLRHQFVALPGIAPRNTRTSNTQLIASKHPIHSAAIFPANWTGAPHIVQCRINKAGPLDIFAVHFPQKKAQVPLFNALLNLPRATMNGRALIVGDINCGIPFEDSETKTFVNTHQFSALLSQGWIDTWRSRDTSAREFTWRSSRSGNGFRYDHALASPSLNRVVEQVRYDHDLRRDRVSDHSAMILDFGSG